MSLEQMSSPSRSLGRLGDSAPVWVPDTRVTMCGSCSVEFSLVLRRHHCRACGKVVCAQCSANKAPLRYRQFEASRVCDACFEGVEKSRFSFVIFALSFLLGHNPHQVVCLTYAQSIGQS